MKRLNDDFDPSQLEGRELETVLYASNLACLQFDEGVVVTVLAELGLIRRGEQRPQKEAPPWNSTRLPTLIGQRVQSASTSEAGQLVLTFQEGSTLELAADESSYESFIVSVRGEEWVA